MSEPVVGRRFSKLSTVSYPVLAVVVAAVAGFGWWLRYVVHNWGHNWQAENLGPSVAGVVGVVVGFVVLVTFGSMLVESLQRFKIESECPRCGARATRMFTTRYRLPTECGACTAYLRAEPSTPRVREEAADAVDTTQVPYKVTAKRAGNRDHFTFPKLCALCGSKDVVAYRKLSLPPTVPSWGGVQVVAKIAVDSLHEQHHGHADTGSDQRAALAHHDQLKVDAERARDRKLADMELPVCAKHTEDEAPMGYVAFHNEGTLEFASYRYYTAFVAANEIR